MTITFKSYKSDTGTWNLEGAEVFSSGEWNGLQFNDTDLDGIVASFDALGLAGRVPLKFGHKGKDARTDGAPALGWVTKVYRNGGKLLADFSSMPGVVHEAINQGMYKFVSIELLKDVPANTRKIPWVLDAVALLGADQPAVGILKDLQALTMARGTGLRGSGHVAFTRDFTSTTPEDISMSVTKEDFEALKKQVVSLTRQNTSLVEALETEKIDRKRADVTAVFERAIEAGRIQPADREKFSRVFKLDDDNAVQNLTVADAEEFIKAVPTPVGFGRKSKTRVPGDEPEFEGTVAEFVSISVEKMNVARGYKADDHAASEESTKILFRRDGKLAQRYFNTPEAAHSEEA